MSIEGRSYRSELFSAFTLTSVPELMR